MGFVWIGGSIGGIIVAVSGYGSMDAFVDCESGREGQQKESAVGHYTDERERGKTQQQTQHTAECQPTPFRTLPKNEMHN